LNGLKDKMKTLEPKFQRFFIVQENYPLEILSQIFLNELKAK